MKKSIVITLLLSFFHFQNSFSQAIDIPMENASWCHGSFGDTGGSLGNFCFSPDTLVEINGKTYAHISYRPHPTSGYQEIHYRSENGQTFVLPQDSTDEIMIYDFNLELGDLFTVNWAWGSGSLLPFDVRVIQIDTIETSDGFDRKFFHMASDSFAFSSEWIEGIGDIDWVFVLPTYEFSVSGGYLEVCFQNNEMVIYPYNGNNVEECFTTSLENTFNDVELKIYPNPSEDFFFVEFKNLHSLRIEVFDNLGKLVLSKENIENNSSFSIPSKNGKGIFFVKIIHEGRPILFEKIIKL